MRIVTPTVMLNYVTVFVILVKKMYLTFLISIKYNRGAEFGDSF